MTAAHPELDRFLATLSPESRAALQRLRRQIRTAAPAAEECIAYGVPSFRWNGRLLVSFGAGKNHCAFYPGAHPIAACARELAGYDTSKGTIRFTPASPLPAALVAKIVRLRLAEHARQAASRRKPPGAPGRK